MTVDTANHNAARIWKAYGTVARKGDNTPERSYRRAKVLSVPEDMAVVPMENFRQVVGLLPRQKAGIDLAAWLLSHGIAVRSTKPYLGAPSTPLRSARSQGRTRTGRLPSSLQTAPCMPGATMCGLRRVATRMRRRLGRSRGKRRFFRAVIRDRLQLRPRRKGCRAWAYQGYSAVPLPGGGVRAGEGGYRPVRYLRQQKGGLPVAGGAGEDLRGVLCKARPGEKRRGGGAVRSRG